MNTCQNCLGMHRIERYIYPSFPYTLYLIVPYCTVTYCVLPYCPAVLYCNVLDSTLWHSKVSEPVTGSDNDDNIDRKT